MNAKTYIVKHPNGYFIPAYDSDKEELDKVSEGELVEVKRVPKNRSPRQHKYFFAIIKKVFENTEGYASADHLRKYLTLRAGYFDELIGVNETFLIPKSLAFDKMNGEDFNTLVSRVLDIVQLEFNIEPELLIAEVEEVVR